MARFTTKITEIVVVGVQATRTIRWRFPAAVVLGVKSRFLIVIMLGWSIIAAKLLVKAVEVRFNIGKHHGFRV